MNERIKNLRLALHLTQGEFADKIGLSRTGYAGVESGTRTVQDRHIKLIVAAFPGVSEEWIRNGTGEMFSQTAAGFSRKYNFSEIIEKLLTAYEALPQDQQVAILDLMNNFAAQFEKDSSRKMTIDEKVEAYRQELIEEERAASSASQTTDAEEIG